MHLLLLLRGEVAHEARHFPKRPADRDHAQRHGGALQFGGDPAELTQRASEQPAEALVPVMYPFLMSPHVIDSAVAQVKLSFAGRMVTK